MTSIQEFPSLPPTKAAPEVFESGHLWIEELVDGDPLRFRVSDSGLIEFGDDERVFAHDEVPLPRRHAVRTIRERFARDAFRRAVDDVESVTFFGVATRLHRIDYDPDATPPFLGTDVYDADRDRFLPPDAVQRIFERVGLSPINVLAREVRAADLDPETYEIPDSDWYDGPAAGVVFRNKAGGRAVRRRTEADPEQDSDPVTIDALLDAHVTDAWLDRIVDACEDGESVTVETLVERAIERLARETGALTGDDAVSVADIRSRLSGRVDEYLRERR